MISATRRSFLRYSALTAASTALGLRSFTGMPALAQPAADYRALVCIFLMGGNDANNMIVPMQGPDYANYQAIRGALAVGQGSLLPLAGPASLGVHAAMPNMQALYNSGGAAVLANVGTLVQPTTRAQYVAAQVTRPNNLFSHRDQQVGWQSANPAVSTTQGWAGNIADHLNSGNGSVPPVISVAGDSLFQHGKTTSGVAIPLSNNYGVPCHEAAPHGCAELLAAEQQLLTTGNGMALVQADNLMLTDAYDYFRQFQQAAQSSSVVKTVFPNTPIGLQLKQVANTMALRGALGAQRQIFYTAFGSFDTHSGQLASHAALLAQLDAAIAAFQLAMAELGLLNNVTTFTMSDFSRVMLPNSSAGTDHAWGGHHFIVGGAVKGGQVYGSMPRFQLGGPDDAEAVGRWIPSTSASQYTATLANWFGVAWSDMAQVVPNIGNFRQPSLGFLATS